MHHSQARWTKILEVGERNLKFAFVLQHFTYIT